MFKRIGLTAVKSFGRTFATKKSGPPAKRVAITGAAGQVAYSILFRIASYFYL